YRFGYVAVLEEERFDQFRSRTIRKFNMESGAQETFSFETGSLCGEPVFVPSRAGKEEDSGYLLVYVTSEVDDSSKLCVFDAQDLAAGPRAAILMPVRVPNGLHGSWINA
ncbi:MAG: carotenoid oxygenase family protein, partial [Pseudomonadota bacterium]|nr:carotenoid oxygenase family protein [Pseudomonadota bacterium]